MQARPLGPDSKPLRRYIIGIIVLGAILGVTARLLIVQLTSPLAPLSDEADAPAAIAQAVPLSPAQTVPLAPNQAVGQTAADPLVDPQQRMAEAIFAPFRGLPGRFGIAVKDLGSGQSVFFNESVAFPAASLFKLPVMYEVFKLRETGSLTFSEELTMSSSDAAWDLGTLAWPIGARISLGTALERMITVSDNTAAIMLTRRIGVRGVNEDAIRLGLKQTRVRTDDLWTSPLDMLRLLEFIASGQAVDEPTSAEMVHLMARQQIRDRIPARLPPETTVANKTGDWEGAAHDVGLVYAPRATLAIAFLSQSTVDSEAVYAAMAQAARDLYEVVNDPYFQTQPSPPLPPRAHDSYLAAVKPPLPSLPSDTRPVRAPAPTVPALALNPEPALVQPTRSARQGDADGTTTPDSLTLQTAPLDPTTTPETTRASRSASERSSTPTATAQPTTTRQASGENTSRRPTATAQPTPRRRD